MIWTGAAVAAGLAGAGRFATPTDSQAFMRQARQLAEGHPGNLAVVLMEKGQVSSVHFQSVGHPVNEDTLFQLASLSKWVTAWGVMKLVEAGRLDLDAPVETYLTRWQLQNDGFETRGVTVRRLLSHTAGLTDGLGYCGYSPGAPIQTLEESLTAASDACRGNGRARVGNEPGRAWRYSGAGYTLLQLLVEEASGEPFADYMRREILMPLGMETSTYKPEEAGPGLAQFFDGRGKLTAHRRYTAVAAASLYSSPRDITRFLQAHLAGRNGEPAGRGVLSPETLVLMSRAEGRTMGRDIWGLGMRLYVSEAGMGQIVGHDGGNTPAINTTARLDLQSGDGIVVLATGDLRLASRIGAEWTVPRRTGVDAAMIVGEAGRMSMWILAGSFLLAGAGVWGTWRAAWIPKG